MVRRKNQELECEQEEIKETSTNCAEETMEQAPMPLKKEKIEITDLPGIGAAIAEKLEATGYGTVLAIAVASPGELFEAAGITEATARKIINAARSTMEMGFESGEELLRRRERVIKIISGSKALDNLVGGGFESGAITEAFGEFGSGKTQIAHVLAVNCQKQFEGSTIVFIDTENTFRPERIKQLCEGIGMDYSKALKNIKVARAYNSDHQILLAEKIEDLITKQNLDIKVVIIDSLTSHFRAEFIGRGTLAERQQKINKHMHTLLKLADTYNVCVYVTNQVSSDPGAFFGDPTKPIGGNIVGHASTFRLYLRKGKKGSRVAKLIDSPNLAEGEASFIVTAEGIKDI